jgi:hypothetical protein
MLVVLAACNGGARSLDALPTTPVELAWIDAETRDGLLWYNIVSMRYVIRQTADLSGVTVERRSDNKSILTYTSDSPRYQPVLVDIAGDHLVIAEEDVRADGGKLPSRAFIYDVSDGARTSLDEIASALPLSLYGGQGAVTDDGRYIYSASLPGSTASDCVAELSLRDLRGRTLECAHDAGESVGYYVSEDEHGATWLRISGPDFMSCRRARGLRNGAIVDIGPSNDCAMLDAATTAGWDIWSAAGRAREPPTETVPLRASDGQRTVDLGPVDAVTLTACGSYVYWRYSDRVNQIIELRRWRPGSGSVEIAYRLDNPDVPGFRQLGLAGCADRIFTLNVFTGDADHGYTRVLATSS